MKVAAEACVALSRGKQTFESYPPRWFESHEEKPCDSTTGSGIENGGVAPSLCAAGRPRSEDHPKARAPLCDVSNRSALRCRCYGRWQEYVRYRRPHLWKRDKECSSLRFLRCVGVTFLLTRLTRFRSDLSVGRREILPSRGCRAGGERRLVVPERHGHRCSRPPSLPPRALHQPRLLLRRQRLPQPA